MRIFVDENIPSVTIQELRTLGYDVMDIRGTDLEGKINGTVVHTH